MGTQGSSQTSLMVMKPVPGFHKLKFKRLHKRLFSRTRQRYSNDCEIGTIIEGVMQAKTMSAAPVKIAITKTKKEDSTRVTDNKDNSDSKRKSIGTYIRAIRSKAKAKVQYSTFHEKQEKRKKRKEQELVLVETVEELRHAVLDQQLSLSNTKIVEREKDAAEANEVAEHAPMMDHAVRNLIKERYLSRSSPGSRVDNSTLAIAIEGGGMRGCVSAGMVAAITALGLSDSIDTIYGSSAGSVVGAYMVSRQVCMDVYVDILPASKKLFVCKKRLVTSLAALGLGRMISRSNSNSFSNKKRVEELARPSLYSLKERLYNSRPGMDISFVLDGILGEDHGLRPLDIDSFRENDKHQKLRVVSSCVDPNTGKLFSKCFGSEDFFHEDNAMVRADQKREGIFACLQASMTVPGATGPPVNLIRRSNIRKNNATSSIENTPFPCFDAFCFEPIPYRSAVEEGATHVIVLASRPEDFVPETKPGIYETAITPLYFKSHGLPKVAEFFEKGGQQYLYAEDLMLLHKARHSKGEGVLVPPPEILYGVERTKEVSSIIGDREKSWKRAHLFPLRVPTGYKELDVLEQDKDAVLEAIRDGFMTAFDSLSDIVGLEGYKGKDVAKLVFPSSLDENTGNEVVSPTAAQVPPVSPTQPSDEEILHTPLHVPGEPIPNLGPAPIDNSSNEELPSDERRRRWRRPRIYKRIRGGLFGFGSHDNRDALHKYNNKNDASREEKRIHLDEGDFSATDLLELLPGFQDGRYGHLAKGLREQHYFQHQQQQQHSEWE